MLGGNRAKRGSDGNSRAVVRLLFKGWTRWIGGSAKQYAPTADPPPPPPPVKM